MLKGIDTSRWQQGLPDATIEADFIIFKATEGIGYTDPDCNPSYQEAKAAGKLLGTYHFARNDGNIGTAGAIAEADYYLSQIKGYIGESIMVLDWEVGNKGEVSWVKTWTDRVHEKTGIWPLVYMSSSVVNSYDWSSVSKNCALWVAQYRDNNIDINYDMSNAGAMPDVNWPNGYAMWQWTSAGRLTGYGGNLDCNIFYGDKAAWTSFATGKPTVKPAPAPVPVPAPAPVPAPVPVPTPKPDPVPVPVPTPVVTPPVQPQDTPLDKDTNAKTGLILSAINWLVEQWKKIFK